ncbi:MAG: hypothetical protein WD294_08450 [Phycisphaeraceae bacterium]
MTLLAVAALTVGSTAPANAAFTEDFSSWENNGDGNLDGGGAELNGWALNGAHRYHVRTLDDRPDVLDNHAASSDETGKSGGKAHGQDLTGATQIDLSFTMQIHFVDSVGQIWASDGNQNGYGLSILGGDESTNATNTLSIIKLSGGTQAFGGNRDATQQGSASVDYVPEVSTDFEDLHLRIEQAAAGDAVTLTAWSDAIESSSYATRRRGCRSPTAEATARSPAMCSTSVR